MIPNNSRELDIFIVGTTAVGKTKLSLALANHFNSEIVSCDSMQLYRHANILTAKATPEEQQQARHHMIDVLELREGGYNRNKFYEQASKVIKELHAGNRPPIVVGGTNYYIETLLFDIEAGGQPEVPTPEQATRIEQTLKSSLPEKYALLQQVDPLLAEKLHPNDEHRVDAYLKKFIMTGEKPSSSYGKPTDKLRNPNTLLFWIRNSDREELRSLMQVRIGSMINREGLVEILSVFACAPKQQEEEGGGVLQSIGYKEFARLVEAVDLKIPKQCTTFQEVQKFVDSQFDNIDWHQHDNLLKQCKEELLTSTFQYAKRQVTWIRNRLFNTDSNNHNFFVLQLSGKGQLSDRFEKQVKTKALQICKIINSEGFGIVEGGLPMMERDKQCKNNFGKGIGEWKKQLCEICNRTLNGQLEYQQHLRTAKHKKTAKLLDKQKQIGQLRLPHPQEHIILSQTVQPSGKT